VAARARTRRAVKRVKDMIWITTTWQASLLETAGIDIVDVVIPGDWGTIAGFDRATLIACRGWWAGAQVAAGTATDIPGIWLAMYVCGLDSPANTMDPYDASSYVNYDVLWTGGLIGEASTRAQPPMEMTVKSKRKLTSGQEVRLAATVPADTGTPRFNVGGTIRALLQLDSQ